MPGSTSEQPSSGAADEGLDDGLQDDTVPDVDPPEVEGDGETNGAPSLAQAAPPPIVLYLNAKGAQISPGQNDSAKNTSQIVISLLSPANGSTFRPGAPLEVKADGSEVPGLTRMDLYWRIGNRTYVYGCPSSRCTIANGTETFRLVPGTGTRGFRVRATDSAGKTYDSATHQIMSQ